MTLAMIVKDEAHVIERCLSSVIPYIDNYVICDTGSTDNTKEIIAREMEEAGIPGVIYDDQWVDFGHNRSLALERCPKDWVLVIDADDSIEGVLPVDQLNDQKDCYMVTLRMGTSSWKRPQLFNLNRKKWRYLEPIHEYPDCGEPYDMGELIGDYKWQARCEGNRSKSNLNESEKYRKDYNILKQCLIKNPKDTRKQFYAAQSAFDAGLFLVAENEYLERIKLGGWHEEIFYSWYKIGKCRQRLNRPDVDIIDAHMSAYEASPSRVESLYELSNYLRGKNRFALAYLIASFGCDKPMTSDVLFIEEHCYKWGVKDEVGSTAFYVGEYKIGLEVCEKLLKEGELPEMQKPRVQSNLNLYKKHLK